MKNEEGTAARQAAQMAVSLRRHFVAHPGYDTVQRLFRKLMDKRQAELELGLTSEGRGIAVIGESGSGKTTAIQRILRRRESEVLPLLLRGYSSKEIARELCISPRTVDIYRSAILGKMRVHKTAQLLFALRGMNFPIQDLLDHAIAA